jgi:hypothetical protein
MKSRHSLSSLAATRRVQSLQGWIIALLIACVPWLLPDLLKATAPVLLKLVKPYLTYVNGACWGLATWLAYQNWLQWQSAQRSTQATVAGPIRGETPLVQSLAPLRQQGWTLEYDVPHKAIGPIGLLATSPRGHLFTVEVKPHRGKVSTSSDGRSLVRIYDRSPRPFEQDFIAQAKQQAQILQKERKAPKATPLILFSEALLDLSQNPVQGVHVVSAPKLRSTLLALDRLALDRR